MDYNFSINTPSEKFPLVFVSLIIVAALIAVNFVFGNPDLFASGKNIQKSLLASSLASSFRAEAAMSEGNQNLGAEETANAKYQPAAPEEIALLNTSIPLLDPLGEQADKNTDLLMPASGFNWGILHHNNAVDIANVCGTPVYAAKDGFVTQDAEDGWNEGYGNYIKMEHSGRIQTLYAHLERSEVSLGKYVKKGELIGYMGNTGDVTGITGCHLHFEVRGAPNPFVK